MDTHVCVCLTLRYGKSCGIYRNCVMSSQPMSSTFCLSNLPKYLLMFAILNMQDSTYEMKRAIADKDRKNDVLAEKLKAHLSLFGSISKEVPSINKFMDDARQALRRKEDVGM